MAVARLQTSSAYTGSSAGWPEAVRWFFAESDSSALKASQVPGSSDERASEDQIIYIQARRLSHRAARRRALQRARLSASGDDFRKRLLGLLETERIKQNPELMGTIKKSKQDIQKGNTYSQEEAHEMLGW
jgi:hypothetical protein